MAVTGNFGGTSQILAKNDNGTLRVGARIPSNTFPKGEVTGDIFYDTVTKILWTWNGTNWDPIGGSGLGVYTISVAAGNGFKNGTSFADVPGPIDLPFTKRATHTALLIWGTMSHYSNVTIGLTAHAVLINGVDYSIGDFFFNQNGVHTTIGLNNRIAAGLAAGNYTARLRWRVVGGAMDINIDSNDSIGLSIMEVP